MNKKNAGEHTLMIKVTEQNGDQLVDARELWNGLESKRKFGDWIKKKVVNNPFFVENEDYTSFHNIVNRANGGNKQVDYILTLDTAKKVAMSEQTEKGAEVRNYFLDVEKKYINNILPSNLPDALELYAKTLREKEVIDKKVIAQKQLIYEKESILLIQAPIMIEHKNITEFMTTTTIAKSFKMKIQDLNIELELLGIQYKHNNVWYLTMEYHGQFLVEDDLKPIKWTHLEGISFLKEKLFNIKKYPQFDVDDF